MPALATPLGKMLLGGRTRYLLDDEFTDTRSAGAVNGSNATPGPGVRTTIETAGTIITNGSAAVITGNAISYSVPAFHYGTFQRVLGRILIVKTGLVNATGPMFGFNQAANAWNAGEGILGSTGNRVRPLNATDLGIAPGAPATQFWAFDLRSIGAYYFYKTLSAFWKLVWIISTGNTANLYVGANEYAATAQPFDFFRIPATLWPPPPLCYDTFTRANGALGSTESVGPDNQAAPALAWTNQVGTVQISGNAAIATVVPVDRAIATCPTASADVLVDIALTKGTTGAGIVLRYQDVDNYDYIWHDGTNLKFVKRVAGIETTLVNAAGAYAAARVIRGILSGTSGSAFYNGALIGATQVVPASSYGLMGLIFFDTDSTLDVFQVFAYGTNNEYSVLDRWSGVNP